MFWGFNKEKSASEGAEKFVAPKTGNQESWRNIHDRSRWEKALTAVGLSFGMLGSAEAGKLQGKEMIGAEIAITTTAMKEVLQLLPENRTITKQGEVTEIDTEGNLDQGMSIGDFIAKMDKNREHKKAVDSFAAAAKIIKDEIKDPQIEKELIIRMGKECEEGTLAITGEDKKTSVGEINTVGDLVNFFAENGKITCKRAFEDNGDIKKSGALTGKIMYAVGQWIEESDPTKSTIEEVEKQVDLF